MANYTARENDEQWLLNLEELQRAFHLPSSVNSLRVRPLNEYLTVCTDGVVTFLSKRERDLVIESVDSPEYGRIFLMCADRNSVIEYCRTSQYEQKPGEVILRIDSKFNEDLIDRIGLEILDHPTIEDSSIHEMISKKLRIPIEILTLGREGYSRYVDVLRKGESEICHASVMILGCGGVGKTTLLKRLITENSIDEIRASTESTQSVDIHQTNASTLLALQSDDHKRIKIDISPILHTGKHQEIGKSPQKENISIQKPKREDESERKMYNLRNLNYGQDHALESTTITSNNDRGNKNVQGTWNIHCFPSAGESRTKRVRDKPEEGNKEMKSNALLQLMPDALQKKGDVNKTIDFYDFAGQYVYYATHQIYLRRSAFYILVTNMRKGWTEKAEPEDHRGDMMFRGMTNEQYLNFWLESIQAFSGRSKPAIILVCTHAEGKSEEEISEYFFYLRSRVKAKKLLDMLSYNREFAVSFETSHALNEIKDCIKKIAKENEYWKRRVPNVWTLFQQKLSEIMTNHNKKLMTFEELQELQVSFPEDMRLQNEDLKFMLKFFHEVLFVLYFDVKDLEKFFILDVNFFKDAFKCIITVKSNVIPKVTRSFHKLWIAFQEKGELPHSLLDDIWNPAFLEHKQHLLMYMKELSLLTEVKKRNTEDTSLLIVPCMNTVQFEPETFKNCQKTSIFYIQLPALANLIFQRLATVLANKLWPIAIAEGNLCLYQNVVIFDHNHLLIAVGSMHDTIQIQLLSYDEEKSTAENIKIKDAIISKLNDIASTIHCSFSHIPGYKCKNTTFCDRTNTCFMPENDIDYTKEYTTCETCAVGENRMVNIKELVSHWKMIQDEDSGMIDKEDTMLLFDFVSGKLCKEKSILCASLLGESHFADALMTNMTLSSEEQVFQILKKWKEMKPNINHSGELKKMIIDTFENKQLVDDMERFSKAKYSFSSIVRPLDLIPSSECELIVKSVTKQRNKLLRFLGLKEHVRERIEEEVRDPQKVMIRSLKCLSDENVLNRGNLCAALNYIGRVDIIEKLNMVWKKHNTDSAKI
ncbi:probable serine/threonine-protein kinase pats1 isoform X2 [Saccostrea cucullata]